MSSSLRIALAIVVFELILPAHVSTARAQQKPLTSDQRQIVDTMSAIFAAARIDDVAKFNSVIASDFYIFDGGERFTADSLLDLIKKQFALGRVTVWTISEPEVHVDCNTALATFTTHGSMHDTTLHKEATWLESAVLRKDDGRWLILFHSTRVPASPPAVPDKK